MSALPTARDQVASYRPGGPVLVPGVLAEGAPLEGAYRRSAAHGAHGSRRQPRRADRLTLSIAPYARPSSSDARGPRQPQAGRGPHRLQGSTEIDIRSRRTRRPGSSRRCVLPPPFTFLAWPGEVPHLRQAVGDAPAPNDRQHRVQSSGRCIVQAKRAGRDQYAGHTPGRRLLRNALPMEWRCSSRGERNPEAGLHCDECVSRS